VTVATLALQPSLLDPEVLDAPAPPREQRAAPAAERADAPARSDERAARAGAPRGRTLEDLLVAAWDGLSESHTASCLVCGGDVAPRYGAGPRPVAGTCRHCGTEIS
jgi:hypothetical protein